MLRQLTIEPDYEQVPREPPRPSPLDLALLVPHDVDFAELAAAWPKLDARQRRQLVALVRSMLPPATFPCRPGRRRT